ncbi:ATP-grasp domain-containing protein [Cohnella nanjingensis]|uniref:ATP-grasp domain-containing protein n=1 Tax=Cohnella nanjingensis TaxID=1387779 RepID=A0A7X0RS63_9BACL|nr:ATP-grasp domain-containing protein [Cohnella nanjingensis]MBB6671506.1 ATP-grasp domain-containing protein [Cohnella nanjingensis]
MNNSNHAAFIIFSGFNQRAVIAFCRVLTTRRIPFFIVALSEQDQILQTSYKERVVAIRSKLSLHQEDLLEQVNKVREKSGVELHYILPSSEALNRHLLIHRRQFENINCLIPLVDEDLYAKISDKYSFGSICKKYGVDVPNELSINDSIHFPVIVKPREYLDSKGAAHSPQFINNFQELERFYEEVNHRDDFYMQDFVPGDSYYLLYYISRDGNIRSFSQKNLIQQGAGKSILAAVPSNLHHSEISHRFEKLLKREGFFGLIMIEVRYFQNKYYMIEANPRLWGPSQLVVDSRAGLFEMMLLDLGFDLQLVRDEINMSARYFWLGGFMDAIAHQSIDFYGISPEQFLFSMNEFIGNEVYLRNDTVEIAICQKKI